MKRLADKVLHWVDALHRDRVELRLELDLIEDLRGGRMHGVAPKVAHDADVERMSTSRSCGHGVGDPLWLLTAR